MWNPLLRGRERGESQRILLVPKIWDLGLPVSTLGRSPVDLYKKN